MSSENLLAKRRAPARPAMKSAIVTPLSDQNIAPAPPKPSPQNVGSLSPVLSKTDIQHTAATTHYSALAIPGAPSNTKPLLQKETITAKSSKPARTTSALMAARMALDYDKKKYSPLCITRMPHGYHTNKFSLIQELRARAPDMYDLLFILKTRAKAINERDPNELTVLQLACSSYSALTISHRISFCRQLLRLHPKAAVQRDSDGQTALHHALQVIPSPSLRLVRTLLAADPSCAKMKDNAGCLPLHVGVMGTASNAVIKMLVLAYPDGIGTTDGAGTTALEYVQSRLKEPSEATVALLSVEGVWKRPDVIMSVDVLEPDPEEVYAAAFLQSWYRKKHAPKLLSVRPVRGMVKVEPTTQTPLSSWSHEAAVTIQALVRGVCLRTRFAEGTKAIICIQRILRGCAARLALYNTMSDYRSKRLRQKSHRLERLRQVHRPVAVNPTIAQAMSGRNGCDSAASRSGGTWDLPDRHESLQEDDNDSSSGDGLTDKQTDAGDTGWSRAVAPAITKQRESQSAGHTAIPAATSTKTDIYVQRLQSAVVPIIYEAMGVLVFYFLLFLWIGATSTVQDFLLQSQGHSASAFARYITSTGPMGTGRHAASFVIPFMGSLQLDHAALLVILISLLCLVCTLQSAMDMIAQYRRHGSIPPKSSRAGLARYTLTSVVCVTVTWAVLAVWLDIHSSAVVALFATMQGGVQYALVCVLASVPVLPIIIFPLLAAFALFT